MINQCSTNRSKLMRASSKYIHRRRLQDFLACLLGVVAVYMFTTIRGSGFESMREGSKSPSRKQTSTRPSLEHVFTSRTGLKIGLNPRSSYDDLKLNDTGDQIILNSVKHAACKRLCDSETKWGDMPLLQAVDALTLQKIRQLSRHFEYLKALRSPQGWNTSTWLTGDKREWECNYVCKIPHAFVDANGRVCAVNDGVCFIQQDCLEAAPDFPMHLKSDLARRDKVIVVSQNWGASIYHAIMENMIKLGDVLEALLAHNDVLVHVPGNTSAAVLFPPFLSAFGIETSRLVHGPLLANYLIYPRATKCGDPSLRQLLKFRQVIEMSDCYGRHAPAGQAKDRVLLVKRGPGKPRSFVNHEELKQALGMVAQAKSYELREFSAPPQPRDKCGIIQDMLIFKHSKVIVAPHGAGLLNTIMCDPGTIIIETQTSDINYVFTRMSMSLGFRHLTFFDPNSKAYTPMVSNIT